MSALGTAKRKAANMVSIANATVTTAAGLIKAAKHLVAHGDAVAAGEALHTATKLLEIAVGEAKAAALNLDNSGISKTATPAANVANLVTASPTCGDCAHRDSSLRLSPCATCAAAFKRFKTKPGFSARAAQGGAA